MVGIKTMQPIGGPKSRGALTPKLTGPNMRSRITVFSLLAAFCIALLYFTGCETVPKETGKASTPREVEIEVLVAFLKENQSFTLEMKPPLLMAREFSIGPSSVGALSRELQRSRTGADVIPADLMKDFCAKNAKPQPLWPELGRRLPIKLLSSDEKKAFFRSTMYDSPTKAEVEAPGFISVSRVGLNRAGDMAMFCSYYVPGFGTGAVWRVHLLKKEEGRWKRQEIHGAMYF